MSGSIEIQSDEDEEEYAEINEKESLNDNEKTQEDD